MSAKSGMLDKYLAEKVKISFNDGHKLWGYLYRAAEYNSNKPKYRLTLCSGAGDIQFKPSAVESIERIEEDTDNDNQQ